MQAHPPRAAWLPALAALAILTPALLGGTRGDTVTTDPVDLGWGREGASAVWTGQDVYVFGGRYFGAAIDNVTRYDPATGAVEEILFTQLIAHAGSSAVWNGTHAFLFGGDGSPVAAEVGNPLDHIQRFDPGTGLVEWMAARLPSERTDTAAAWTGTHAFIFGGHDVMGALDEILRYDPASDTLTLLSAKLPSGRWGASAAYDGTHIYVLGGAQGSGQNSHTHLAEIVRFDPATGQVTVMPATLPTPRHYMAAWSDGADPLDPYNATKPFHGDFIYLLGGHEGHSPANATFTDQILQYRPDPERLRTLPGTLPHRQAWMGGVWAGDKGFVLGGYTSDLPCQLCYLDTVVRHDPRIHAVTGLGAAPGPGAGQVTLTWTAPAGETATAYRIYRGEPGEANPPFHAQVDGATTTFTDSGLPNGATKKYVVAARNGDYALDGPSVSVLGTAPTPPGPPRRLDADPNVGSASIHLAWIAPLSDGGIPITGYQVWRGVQGQTLTLRAELGNVLAHDDPCTATVVYEYEVRAVNGAGAGDPSNRVTATCV